MIRGASADAIAIITILCLCYSYALPQQALPATLYMSCPALRVVAHGLTRMRDENIE